MFHNLIGLQTLLFNVVHVFMVFFYISLICTNTQVRMQPWPFRKPSTRSSKSLHCLRPSDGGLSVQPPWKKWEKMSDTQKVNFNLSRIPAVLPSPKWGQGSQNVCRDRLTDFVSRLWELFSPRGCCCRLVSAGVYFSCNFRSLNWSLRSSKTQSHHKGSNQSQQNTLVKNEDYTGYILSKVKNVSYLQILVRWLNHRVACEQRWDCLAW